MKPASAPIQLKATLSIGLLLASGALSPAQDFSRDELKELRSTAMELFGPIPDKMPGSENDTPERIVLGRNLFFDTVLSKNNTISCNTCHPIHQGLGGVDNLPVSLGAFGETGDRNAPTVLNAGFHIAQFWDGRAADLVEQAKGPVLNPIEMAMPDEDLVLDRLRKDESYREQFKEAFPSDADTETLNYQNVAEAIAAFERTLITEDRFDDFLEGDLEALTTQELRGLSKFTAMGCTTCHSGPLLGGTLYQKVGLVNPYENFSDKGRSAVTDDEDDDYKFKVPSLRNAAITGPYFHDGGVATLEFAVRKMAWMQLGLQMSTEDARDIVAFLKSLTDKERLPEE